jgi:hypothetical protein
VHGPLYSEAAHQGLFGYRTLMLPVVLRCQSKNLWFLRQDSWASPYRRNQLL